MPIIAFGDEAWARLGKRIRAERERAGLSRKELADLAGVSVGSLQTAEGGKRPSGRWPQSLSAIERALGWAPESVIAVLKGDEPTVLAPPPKPPASSSRSQRDIPGALLGDSGVDLLFTDGSDVRVVQLKSADTQPSVDDLVEKISELPPTVRDWLEHVMAFGVRAVEVGAPYWLGQAYDHALVSLLAALVDASEIDEGVRSQSAQQLSAASPLRPWRVANREADLRQALRARIRELEMSVASAKGQVSFIEKKMKEGESDAYPEGLLQRMLEDTRDRVVVAERQLMAERRRAAVELESERRSEYDV